MEDSFDVEMAEFRKSITKDDSNDNESLLDYEEEEENTVEVKEQQEGENIREPGQEAAHAQVTGDQEQEQEEAGGTGLAGEERREVVVQGIGADAEGDGGEGERGQGGEGEGGEPAEIPDPDPVIILTPPKPALPSFIPNRRYYAVKEVKASGTPCRPLNKRSKV